MTKDEKRRRELVNSYNFEKWLNEEKEFSASAAEMMCNECFGKAGDSWFSEFKYAVLYGDYGKKGRK